MLEQASVLPTASKEHSIMQFPLEKCISNFKLRLFLSPFHSNTAQGWKLPLFSKSGNFLSLFETQLPYLHLCPWSKCFQLTRKFLDQPETHAIMNQQHKDCCIFYAPNKHSLRNAAKGYRLPRS